MREEFEKYQEAKRKLKICANAAKEAFGDDKPAIMESINNFTDWLIKDHHWSGTRYEVWLSNLAARLHP